MTTDAKTEGVASAAPPLPVSSIRDNYRRGTVGGFLREKIREDSKLSVVSAYFTIYAYEALRDTLDQIDHLDFLFGEPTYVNRLDPDKTAKKSFVIDEDGLELANRLQQKRVAKDCSEWIERKEDIRTIKQSNLLHGKMYHVANGGDFFVHDDGTVRFGFAQPKESMLLLRDLAAGEPTAFEKLCDIFDQRTEDGANMTHYDGLLKKALASIEHTFQKRAASSLLTSRDAVLPAATETPTSDGGDFDLVTWLVILGGSTS